MVDKAGDAGDAVLLGFFGAVSGSATAELLVGFDEAGCVNAFIAPSTRSGVNTYHTRTTNF